MYEMADSTITITDKKHQKQDIVNFNRNTKNSLNHMAVEIQNCKGMLTKRKAHLMLTEFLKRNISGNVTGINMDNKKVISLIMIKHEMVFNYLSEHIEKIIFTNHHVVCEPIYRYVKNIPNERKISWQIFSDERNLPSRKMVIVIWLWNKKEDMVNYRRSKEEKDTGTKFKNKFPCLHSYVHVCDENEMQNVFVKLALLDNLIASGIHLGERREIDFPNVAWNEIEVYRSYDWGQVEGAWNRLKENVQIETITENIGELLMESVNRSPYKEDAQLTFDYPYPVEDYIYKVILDKR